MRLDLRHADAETGDDQSERAASFGGHLAQDYHALQATKMNQLKADLQEGVDDLANRRFSTKSAAEIIAARKKRLQARKADATH